MILSNQNLKGHYFGDYSISLEDFQSVDFSKKCFVVSGQGSLSPGDMKGVFNNNSDFRRLIEIIESRLSFYGVESSVKDFLNDTKTPVIEEMNLIRNISLFSLHMGMLYELKKKNIYPTMITGYSFGEFSTLALSGIVSVPEMVDYLVMREKFSSEMSFKGEMIALSATKDILLKGQEEAGFLISNINSPKQYTISCLQENLESTKAWLKKNRVPHKALKNVPYPYHTPWMESVCMKLADFIESKSWNFRAPETPMYSSVFKKLITKENFDPQEIKEIMTKQNITQLNFQKQIEDIYGHNIANYIELSPNVVLSTFIKNTLFDKDIKINQASALFQKDENESLSQTIKVSDSKYFKLVSKIIAKVTGYELEEIAIEDRYQEDLGIDSIKKAEIFFNILQEEGITPDSVIGKSDINLGSFKTVGETAQFLDSFKEAALTNETHENLVPGKFNRTKITYHNRWAPGFHYPLTQEKNVQVVNLKDDKLEVKANVNYLHLIIDDLNFSDDQLKNNLVIIEKMKGFLSKLPKDIHLGVFIDSELEKTSGIKSFLKSIRMETKEGLQLKVISNIQTKSLNQEYLQKIYEKVEYDLLENDFRMNSGELTTPKLEVINEKKTHDLNTFKRIVFIGGAKGIGKILSEKMLEDFSPEIVWVGRSPSRKLHIPEGIHYRQCDMTQPNEVQNLFEDIGSVDLIINAAGIEVSRLFSEKETPEIESELKAKIESTRNILDVLKNKRDTKAIFFSSTVAHFGNAGQSTYSMANETITEMIEEFPALMTKVVHWPAWDSVGMTTNPGILHRLRQSGLKLMTLEDAYPLLIQDITNWNASERSIYYINSLDRIKIEHLSFDLKQFIPSIGYFSNPAQLEFKKEISTTKQPYLIDHTLGETTVYPGSMAIAAGLILGRSYFRDPQMSLKNFRAKNMLVVDEKPNVLKTQSRFDNDSLYFDISTSVSNYDGVISKNEKKLPQEKMALPKAVKEIDLVNSFYTEQCINLGKSYQVSKKAILDENDQLYVTGHFVNEFKYTDSPDFDYYSYISELGLQTVGMFALFRKSGLSVPHYVEEIAINTQAEFTSTVYSVPKVFKIEEEKVFGEATLYNDKFQPIMKLYGVEMIAIVKELHQNPLIINEVE